VAGRLGRSRASCVGTVLGGAEPASTGVAVSRTSMLSLRARLGTSVSSTDSDPPSASSRSGWLSGSNPSFVPVIE